MNIKFYEIDNSYIDYLAQFAPHLFHNSQQNQQNNRKYIGILFSINNFDYFAPLSSFKSKHEHMQESMDFIKVGNYAVINLNNMFPAKAVYCNYIYFSNEQDYKYRQLLEAEYRIIVKKQEKIIKSANNLYNYKIKYGTSTALARRCNDFRLLEEKAKLYR